MPAEFEATVNNHKYTFPPITLKHGEQFKLSYTIKEDEVYAIFLIDSEGVSHQGKLVENE